jgi:hypothetical protein
LADLADLAGLADFEVLDALAFVVLAAFPAALVFLVVAICSA